MASIMTLLTVWFNLRLRIVSHAASPASDRLPPDVLLQLNNIKRRLVAGEGNAMQRLFPEGWFFSHILYGYTWVNVALSAESESLRQQAVREVRWVLIQTDSPRGRAPFAAHTQVSHGVFYLGWTNRLLGGLLKIQRPNERALADINRFQSQSAELAQAFANSAIAHLTAYPNQTWPCDQTVALASLALHDDLYSSNFQPIIQKWVNYSRQHLDPATDLIPHKIDATTGHIQIGARGSSQVYLLAFLPELDAAFAAEQYTRFRANFVVPGPGFLPVREYPIGRNGFGDVDSGPLIFGIGPTSTIVSLAAARTNGDAQLFESTWSLLEILGFPAIQGQEKSFGLGLLVVADGFIAWGNSLVPWTETPSASYSLESLDYRLWDWHWGSGIGLFMLWMAIARFAVLGIFKGSDNDCAPTDEKIDGATGPTVKQLLTTQAVVCYAPSHSSMSRSTS